MVSNIEGIVILDERVRLRPEKPGEDEQFLSDLYSSTRYDLAALPIGEEMKEGLMKMQFKAQRIQYAADFPNAINYIVERDSTPVGRLMVDITGPDLVGVDIAIMPSMRNIGIGRTVLEYLLDKTLREFRSMRIQVTKVNPARRLYERLGFVVSCETDTHFQMIWIKS